MFGKVITFALESVYTSFVLFFYYYLILTFVQFRPFAFVFNPPYDVVRLSTDFVIILGAVVLLKSIAVVSFLLNSERQPKEPISRINDL